LVLADAEDALKAPFPSEGDSALGSYHGYGIGIEKSTPEVILCIGRIYRIHKYISFIKDMCENIKG
jgi:hypothetical protein